MIKLYCWQTNNKRGIFLSVIHRSIEQILMHLPIPGVHHHALHQQVELIRKLFNDIFRIRNQIFIDNQAKLNFSIVRQNTDAHTYGAILRHPKHDFFNLSSRDVQRHLWTRYIGQHRGGFFGKQMQYSKKVFAPVVTRIKENHGKIIDGPLYPGKKFKIQRELFMYFLKDIAHKQ